MPGAAAKPTPCVPERDAAGDRSDLLTGAAALGVELNPAQADALLGFGALLARWNQAFNLVSRRDIERLLPRHLLDSLSAATELAPSRVLDLGTGAGLPGVPLAIVQPQLQFTLVDRNERKIRFIGQVVRELGLANVTPLCADVARMPGNDSFDTVVTRAVAAPAGIWALAEPRLAPAGRLVLLHRVHDGRTTQAADGAAPESAAPPGTRIFGRRLAAIPGLAERHEVLVLGRASEAQGHDRSAH